VLKTERLIIRPFTPGDWRDLHAYLSREDVVKYEPYGVFSEEASKAEARRRSEDKHFHAVCLKDGGKLIGNVYLAEQDFGTWELGFVFNADYHGKGYATEAAAAVIDNAVKNGARRITAQCNPLNEPSRRLLERLGMVREGCLRQNIYFKTDTAGRPVWQDTYIYGILAGEWPGRL